MPAILATAPPRRRNETRDLLRPILRAVNALGYVRMVRNANLGPVAPWARRFEQTFPILAGLGPGSADLVGVLRPMGRLVALEIKWPKETLRPEQEAWIRAVRGYGAFAAVVHSVEEALEAIGRARAGETR